MLICNLLLLIMGVLVLKEENKLKSWSEKHGVKGRGMKRGWWLMFNGQTELDSLSELKNVI